MAGTRVQAGARQAVPDEDGLAAIELVAVEKEFTAGGHDVRAVERVDLQIAEASSSRCLARRAAARPPPCG